MIEIQRLTKPSERAARDIHGLLPQLTDAAWPMTAERLGQILAAPTWVFVAVDSDKGGRIVGTAMIAFVYQLKDTKGWLEDVVVDEAYRGQGIAKQLVQACIDAAREAGARSVNMTSSFHREAAHKVYERLGFVRRESYVYRLRLSEADARDA